MCCNRRRERRGLGAVGLTLAGAAINAARNNYNAKHGHLIEASAHPGQSTGIVSLTDSVNKLTLDESQTSDSEKYTPSHNVVSIPVASDEKKEGDGFEAPPAYAEVPNSTAPRKVSFAVSDAEQRDTESQTQAQAQTDYQPRSGLPVPVGSNDTKLTASNPYVQAAFTALEKALATPHQRGNKCAIKRAKRMLRNSLYDAEIERREAAFGRIGCKEKKIVWRNVKQNVRLIGA